MADVKRLGNIYDNKKFIGTNEDFDKASASGVSNSQLYKQAGNAIVKQVLMGIFAQMIPQSARSGS